MAEDLVCGMQVDKSSAQFFSEYGNDKFFFCSPECKRAFDDHPDRYIREKSKRTSGT